MGKVSDKELELQMIADRKYLDAVYKKYSVNCGSNVGCCVPESVAVQLFGNNALGFIKSVGYIEKCGYTVLYNGEWYVTTSGYSLMRAYKANELYHTYYESEVDNSDSGAGEQH